MTPPFPSDVLKERIQAAKTYLYDALRVEVVGFISGELERRLLERPHFSAQMAVDRLLRLRAEIDRESRIAQAALWQAVLVLRQTWNQSRAHFAEAEEASALGRLIGEHVTSSVSEILLFYGFPSDHRPDVPNDKVLEIEPSFRVCYEAGAALLWAWRKLRALDRIKDLFDDAARRRTPLITCYLPEALAARAI